MTKQEIAETAMMLVILSGETFAGHFHTTIGNFSPSLGVIGPFYFWVAISLIERATELSGGFTFFFPREDFPSAREDVQIREIQFITL